MSTRRERLEAKKEKRESWAESADGRSAAGFKRAQDIASYIPMGQPILVGHHSEKRHRRDLKRMDAGMDKGVAEKNKADHHRSKAVGLERQLETSIFSDDADAIEQLDAKIERLEVQREEMKAANKAWSKPLPLCNYRAAEPIVAINSFHGTEDWVLPQIEMTKAEYAAFPKDYRGTSVVEHSHRVRVVSRGGMHSVYLTDSKEKAKPDRAPDRSTKPYPPYALTNIGGRIKQARERIGEVERRQDRAAAAEEAGGVQIESNERYCVITFAEKPERSILVELRAGDFRFSGGAWLGETENIPASVHALAQEAEGDGDQADD